MRGTAGATNTAAGMRRRGRGAARIRQMGMTGLVLGVLTGCGEDPTGPVAPPAVTAVVVSPNAYALAAGETIQLQAFAVTSKGDTLRNALITWASQDTSVARVSAGGMVTARKAGTSKVTAASSGREGHAMITVLEIVPDPVINGFSPASAAVGGPDLLLTVRGSGFGPTARVQWNGHARPTAFVNESELRVTIWAGDRAEAGMARVQVVNPASGGASAEVNFPIVPQLNPVAQVELSHSIAITIPGAAVPVQVSLRDAQGNLLQDRLVTWTSSNHLVATVNGTGVIAPTGIGEVTITASSEGKSATVALSVGTKPTHLILDDPVKGLAVVNMRLGGPPTGFWQLATGSRIAEPSASPDGRFFAYTVHLGTVRAVAVMDQATRTYLFLTNDAWSDQPAWSPTAGRIAFRSRRAGRDDIWVMNDDGTGAANLTATMPQGWQAGHPAWSPDGTRLVFSAGPSEEHMTLYVMKADGTSIQPLLPSVYQDVEPSWNGNAVVFTRRRPDGTSDLFRVAVIGGGPLVQLTHTGDASAPAWSPDGRWIAFAAGPAAGGRQSIMAVRPFGEEVRPLSLNTQADGGGSNPAWLTHN